MYYNIVSCFTIFDCELSIWIFVDISVYCYIDFVVITGLDCNTNKASSCSY